MAWSMGKIPLPSGATITYFPTKGTAKIEQSLARLAQGHNITGLALTDAWDVMAAVDAEAADLLGWDGGIENRQFVRLDLVRDFQDVPDIPQLLNALANDVSYRRTGTQRYTKQRGGAGGSIYRGPTTSTAVLYDKEFEVRSRRAAMEHISPNVLALAQGKVRYELRLRRKALVQSGLSSVRSVTNSLLEHIVRRKLRAVPVRS